MEGGREHMWHWRGTLSKMLRMFLERMAPASSIAKPACMKMTSMAANRIHMVSIP
jgi:hypothetical protein